MFKTHDFMLFNYILANTNCSKVVVAEAAAVIVVAVNKSVP